MSCLCFFCFVAFDSLEGGRGKGFKEAKLEITQKIQYLVRLVFCTLTQVQMLNLMVKQIKMLVLMCLHLEDKFLWIIQSIYSLSKR